jgi:chromate reductase
MMKKMTILVASSGKNVELGNKVKDYASENGFEVSMINLVELELPLYSTEEEQNGIPQKAKDLTKSLIDADSLVVISPEYNGSMAPSLNNAVAWVSRSSEQWREAFNGKPTVIGTHSGGGGVNVLMAMRQQLSYLGANVIGRQLHTNYSKELSADSLNGCLSQLK